jgi:hypothetical protein
MTTPATIGREPIQLVGLTQPRCSRRFGVAPCAATTADGPRCYQTFSTCLSVPNILYDGEIEWLFGKSEVLSDAVVTPGGEVTLDQEDGTALFIESASSLFVPSGSTGLITADALTFVTGDAIEGGWIGSSNPLLTYRRSGEAIRTNPIPSLVSVSESASRLNVGAARDGESPFGIRSSVSVQFRDILWNDHVGDFYLAQRSGTRGGFWQKWAARNLYFSNMYVTVYEGYRGQTLDEMQQRLYIVEKVDGPDASGNVTLSGIDPLRLADSKRAKFPRVTDMALVNAVTISDTTGLVVRAALADLTDTFGNVSTRYMRIASEIIAYTGQTETGVGTGQYTLSGVARGQLGTTAAAQSANAAAQRAGRYSVITAWDAIYDLLTQHTDLPASFINKAQWDAEAALYLEGFDVTTTIAEPTAVEQLCGEIMQQTSLYIWWDERLQTIPLKAVRPEVARVSVTDDANILAGSARLTRDADAWFTQLIVYYLQRDPTKGFDPTNFGLVRGRVDGEAELPAAGDTVRQKVIYSRWLINEAQATELTVRLLGRFRRVPRFLSVRLDAKDRTILIGDVVSVQSGSVTDSEGNATAEVWQVIRVDEIEPGHSVIYDLQEFQFKAARYAVMMATPSPDFSVATTTEKETGCWLCGIDDKMADGTDGYALQ